MHDGGVRPGPRSHTHAVRGIDDLILVGACTSFIRTGGLLLVDRHLAYLCCLLQPTLQLACRSALVILARSTGVFMRKAVKWREKFQLTIGDRGSSVRSVSEHWAAPAPMSGTALLAPDGTTERRSGFPWARRVCTTWLLAVTPEECSVTSDRASRAAGPSAEWVSETRCQRSVSPNPRTLDFRRHSQCVHQYRCHSLCHLQMSLSPSEAGGGRARSPAASRSARPRADLRALGTTPGVFTERARPIPDRYSIATA